MGWSTNDELNYVRQLGSFAARRSRSPVRRIALFKKYLKSAEERSDWGRVDRRLVINCVLQEIKLSGGVVT